MADPLRELLAFQEKVNRLFDNALVRSEFGEAAVRAGGGRTVYRHLDADG